MTYAMPSNISGVTGLLTYVNTITGSAFGILILLALWVIIFVMMKIQFHKVSDCFFVASVMGVLVGSLLWAIPILSGRFVILMMALSVLGAIWVQFDN